MINYWIPLLAIALIVEELFLPAYSTKIVLGDEVNTILAVEGDCLDIKCCYPKSKKYQSQWEKSSGPETPLHKLSVTGHWLNFKNVKPSDQGQYYCLIKQEKIVSKIWSNFTLITFERSKATDYEKLPNITAPLSLSVKKNKSKPKFTNELIMDNNVALLIGDNLNLSCPIMILNTSVVSSSWEKNYSVLEYSNSTVDNNYKKNNVQLSDAGNYTCVVNNEFGTIRHNFNVSVYEDRTKVPLLVEYPIDLTLKVGDTARFSCKTFQQKKVDWYYFKDTNPCNINIEDISGFIPISNSNNTNVRSNGILILKNFTTNNVGWYVCYTTIYETDVMSGAKLEVEKKLGPEPTAMDGLLRFLWNHQFAVLFILCFVLLTFVCSLMLLKTRKENDELKQQVVFETAKSATIVHMTKTICQGTLRIQPVTGVQV